MLRFFAARRPIQLQERIMADLFDNPMGTDGFEFVEYTAPDTEA